MSYFQRTAVDPIHKPTIVGVKKTSNLKQSTLPDDIDKPTTQVDNKNKLGGSGSGNLGGKIGAVGNAIGSIATMNESGVDTSGNTNYGQEKGDVGMSAFSGAADGASKGAAFGLPGIIGGGIIGAVTGWIGGDKKKRDLALAKKRFNRKRSLDSENTLDNITQKEEMDDILSEDNIEYMAQLNNPRYQRFKRNSQYTV